MKTTGRVADLSMLADSIDVLSDKAGLAFAVRNASQAQSCISDLTLAQHSLEALAQLSDADWPASPTHRLATEHSLLSNAIILYARATAIGARKGERGRIDIRHSLTPEQQIDHDRVVNIRNLAVAHVRPNTVIDGDHWHRDVVFAVEAINGAWLSAAMTRRVQVHGELAACLRKLIPAAEKLLILTYEKRLNHVTERLQATPGIGTYLEDNPLDLVAFFGSAEEGRRALANPGARRSTGIINH